MAVAAVIRAWTLNVGPQVTVTVAVTVAAIVVWSSLVAAILRAAAQAVAHRPRDRSGVIAPSSTQRGRSSIMIAHLTLTQLQGL
ncbi:mg2+ transport transmembrane MgtE domain protein [Mycobacterium ulcerans str. Harvey]|uniref:Mg2+ transport transmembrane MgtE domain protein n=1 Tax=Mycobacterium ulcerans str. Harvey TaxID=1299332 RepID=A0ABN0RAB7_MYCUL|nr:mg2+ transport transmembrane MgtE domain protein [Mycobacterium ulcerans str. Harvey]